MSGIDEIKALLKDALMLGKRADSLEPSTRLYGAMPSFDSIAVVSVVAAMEEQLGLEVDDEEISAEIFQTVGSLAEFVENKRRASGGG